MKKRIRLSLSTVYHSLFAADGVLESLVNLNLNTSLSLLLLRTVSSDDLLGLGEIGSDGLWSPKPSGFYRMCVLRTTNLNRDVL